MSERRLWLLWLLFGILCVAIWAHAVRAVSNCTESPNGVWVCTDAVIVNDGNVLPTPIANAVRLLDNSSIAPTPAAEAGVALLTDLDPGAPEDWRLLCGATNSLHCPLVTADLPADIQALLNTPTVTPTPTQTPTPTATPTQIVCGAQTWLSTLGIDHTHACTGANTPTLVPTGTATPTATAAPTYAEWNTGTTGVGGWTGAPTLATSLTVPSIIGKAALTIKPGADSTTAVQVQNASATPVVWVDTTNKQVGIGAVPFAPLTVNSAPPAYKGAMGIVDPRYTASDLCSEGGFTSWGSDFGSGNTGRQFFIGKSGGCGALGNDLMVYYQLNGAIGLYTNSSERLRISAGGLVGIGLANGVTPDAKLHVTSTAAATIAQIIKGASSQSANLTEWQDSNAVRMKYVTAAGNLGFGGGTAHTISMDANTTANSTGNSLTINAGAAPTPLATSTPTITPTGVWSTPTAVATPTSIRDKAGGNLILSAGNGTGSGGSVINFQVAALPVSASTPYPTPTPGGSAANAAITTMRLSQFGHLILVDSLPPAISSCGTGTPVAVGTDMAGRLTLGTGTPSTCTLTFHRPWENPPVCHIEVEGTHTANQEPEVTSITTTTLVVSAHAGNFADGEVMTWICLGWATS